MAVGSVDTAGMSTSRGGWMLATPSRVFCNDTHYSRIQVCMLIFFDIVMLETSFWCDLLVDNYITKVINTEYCVIRSTVL